ncbi:MAG: T9SS type A sorting domain-containing protein [Chitinophagales bacterium]|nr:T9SS type A sorting domain-containing protein [Chitinophagales bacterium]
MKNILITILFCFLAIALQAQDTTYYFQKTFNPGPDTTNLLINAVLPAEDGYIAVGGYTSLNDKAVFAVKFNWQGDTIWFKILDNSYTVGNLVWGQEFIRTRDDNYVLYYSKVLNMSKDIKLVKFDTNGNILWNRAYGDYANEEIYQITETSDGGFALFGATQYPADTVRYLLMKIKPDLEEDWTKTYMLDSSTKGLSFQQTPDGGYILSGYAYSDTSGYDTYIIKTDSLGAVEWTNNYGGQYNDCGGKVNLLANGQYLVTSCYYPNDNITRYARLSKLNSNGTMVWDSIYYTKPRCASPQTPVVFLSDSSFVTVMAYSTVSTGRVSNLLACFDLSGNILWEREFSSNLNEDVYLKDLRRTADGGFIMAGYEYTSTPQKGYLVKTDSLGLSCSVLECDSVAYHFPDAVSPPILPPPQTFFSIYPNPAQDYLVVENNSLEKNATFVLYDVVGRRVLSVISHNQSIVSVEHLPSGVYLYQFLNPQNQIVAYGKVSVVR